MDNWLKRARFYGGRSGVFLDFAAWINVNLAFVRKKHDTFRSDLSVIHLLWL